MPAGDQDRPFFRARVGFTFGSYGYDQAPLAQGGTLYPKSITFPAGTTGVTLNARYFQPNFRYLGLEGALRVTSYAVDPTPLCAGLGKPCDGTPSVADALVDLHLLGVARYAFDTGNSMFWAGARIGYGYGDVQGISATDTTIDFPQFKVNALGLGAELGGEIGDRLLVQAGFTEYLAGGGSPYDTTFGLELAYSLTDLVYLSGAYDLSARKVSVLDNDNNKVGEISDTLNVGTISVGISL